MDKDELYRTLLDGLSRYLDSAFARDVLRTVSRYPTPGLAHSLNKNQVASKLWLLNGLFQVQRGSLGTVLVLGGWHGVLAAMLMDDARFRPQMVVSVDIDPRCQEVAETLNERHLEAGRFVAMTADMRALDYHQLPVSTPHGRQLLRPDLIMNTSCEHLAQFDAWYRRLPRGTRLLLQSNDYYDCDEHCNCVPDVAALQAQAPMRELELADTLPLKRYRRFMVIGRR